jgi:hypothetical protein
VGVTEWEPIKIAHRNLAYIQKLTRHPTLLTRRDHIAIAKLPAFETGLGTAGETQTSATKTTCEIDDKKQLKNSLYPHRHFAEQLVGTFGKSPRESDLDSNTWHLICNSSNLNFIYGIVCLYVCVCAFSLHRESPDMILGDKPLISEAVLSQLLSLGPSCLLLLLCGLPIELDSLL